MEINKNWLTFYGKKNPDFELSRPDLEDFIRMGLNMEISVEIAQIKSDKVFDLLDISR